MKKSSISNIYELKKDGKLNEICLLNPKICNRKKYCIKLKQVYLASFKRFLYGFTQIFTFYEK